MSLLFIFVDGVGLGTDDPAVNPFAQASLPNLHALLGGQRMLAGNNGPDRPIVETGRASLIALDACLGVEGLPQSATGQAALLTGTNAPARLGYHDGPKPNPEVAEILKGGNLFSTLLEAGLKVGMLNAFPPGYFHSLASGRRLPGAIAMAARQAGLNLKTQEDLYRGQALSADFTGQGWRDHLGLHDTPVIAPEKAGERLAELARQHDFAIFEFWLSDIAGHHQNMPEACALLETFDRVLGGLLPAWQDDKGLIILTSDHGNLEDLSTRRHTTNPVPLLLAGSPALRKQFGPHGRDLTSIAPAIEEFFQAH